MGAVGQGHRPLLPLRATCSRAAWTASCGRRGSTVRVLIVDDCSPTTPPTSGAAWPRQDDRVEYRRHDDNMGLIATANEGLEWADDSDYVVLLSADDLLVPGSLGRAVDGDGVAPGGGPGLRARAVLRARRAAAAVRTRWRGTTVWSGRDWIELRCRTGHNCIASPEAVVRTSVQRQVGRYDPACYHTSDLNMWLRIAAVADVAYVRGAMQALYRIHSDSMLRSMLARWRTAGRPERTTGRLRALLRRRRRRASGTPPSCSATVAAHAGPPGPLAGEPRLRPRRGPRPRTRSRSTELVEFALETSPEARQLREWRGLRLRQRIGAGPLARSSCRSSPPGRRIACAATSATGGCTGAGSERRTPPVSASSRGRRNVVFRWH